MRKNLRFVGLDVHQDSISVAVAESGREPARLLETIPADELTAAQVARSSRSQVSLAGVL